MKLSKIFYFLQIIMLSALFLSNCSSRKSTSPTGLEENPTRTNYFLVDSLATPETIALFKNLKKLAMKGVLFGHQDDLAYGINWNSEPGRSDVKEVCGDFPAVYGWDLGDIHSPNNLDGVNFSFMKIWITEAYNRGGINTISMHLDNPVTNGDAWDNSAAVGSILPGKSHHAQYLKTLDLIAKFLKDLKTPEGVYIPVIFRPYHEHNHTWAWWGSNSCSVADYNALWRMTVEYLRDKQKIHHLLYAISPQEINSESEYLARYPGDNYVDILGLDYYKLYDKKYVTELGKVLEIVVKLAEQRGKIAALTETGVDKVPFANFWTDYLLAAFKYNEESKKVAWSLVWRNASKQHHFAPYPGHFSTANFVKFYNDPLTLFENDLPDLYHE